ncbi:helix-turn-helix domain-containing protein [Streptococcus cameli]
MHITLLMEKAEQAQYELIAYLHRFDKPLHLKQIMEDLNCSKVTLLKYIDALNDKMTEKQLACSIISDGQEAELALGNQLAWEELVVVFLENSVKWQILGYLYQHSHFSIPQLALKLMVSEATLNRHLASLNQILAEFDLAISQGSLMGPELQKRYVYYRLKKIVLSTREKQDLIEKLEHKRMILLLERLCGAPLSSQKKQDLALWLWVSQQHFSNKKKDFLHLNDAMLPYQKNVFYQRLERATLHHFSQYAMEFDEGEAQALFAFMASQFVLPIQTIEYIFGFGGPISDAITNSIRLIKKEGIIDKKRHEQIIYVLGQLLAGQYFFKGSILRHQWSYQVQQHPIAEYATPQLQTITRQLLPEGSSKDQWLEMQWKVLQLLIFLVREKHHPLKVALHTGDCILERELLVLLLQKRLENNQMIELLPYEEKKEYDCMITTSVLSSEPSYPTYLLKNDFAVKDIENLVLFLKDCLENKNQTKLS